MTPEQLLACEFLAVAGSLRTARTEVCHLVRDGHRAVMGEGYKHTRLVLEAFEVIVALEVLAQRLGVPRGATGPEAAVTHNREPGEEG
jgi:hypothetical protein